MTKELVIKAYGEWLSTGKNSEYVKINGFDQSAGAYFLAYCLVEAGLVDEAFKKDVSKFLGTVGVGWLNFSQHTQMLRKAGCVVDPEEKEAALLE